MKGLGPDADAARLAARFRAGKPCRHVVVDGFLEPALARAVARDLPGPNDECFTEGRHGGDGVAICRTPEKLGPGWARLDALTRSPEFLVWLGRACGVPGILRNTESSCGGLFRYVHDSEMDVHVDSNDVDVHCAQVGHRRKINMLLYLTPGWREEWGGSFDLYAHPSRPPAKTVMPLFNRCVFFDSYRSWHGVAPITLPRGKEHVARLALILNFYSTNRKGVPKAPPHYNILMPRPLPARLRPGKTPELADLVEISRLLSRRDARLGSLRGLEHSARTGNPAPVSRTAKAAPFGFLDALPPEVRPGKALTRRGYAALRRLFSQRDRELRRLYRGQYDAIQKLKARAPNLVPAGY
jgi:hypothetical protein